MKKHLISALLMITCIASVISCKKKTEEEKEMDEIARADVHDHDNIIPIDTTNFDAFFAKYPKFKDFEGEVRKLYQKHDHYIWHDKKGLIEFADVLHHLSSNLEEEGVKKNIPYKDTLDQLFYKGNNEPDIESELLVSSMYFYYAKNVLQGLDPEQSKETGWYLPRDRVDYVSYLDTLMKKPELIKKDKEEVFTQYYNLRKGLEKYRIIQKKGGWGKITLDEGVKSIKVGDSAQAVAQVRNRLFIEGYISNDSKSTVFDNELLKAINTYESVHHRDPDSTITSSIVNELNIPVEERIKTITVNMERCRWVPAAINSEKEYIAVNIPSYRLFYFRDKDTVLVSKVVVGKALHKTVIFSGEMSYIVFSPYWNVPQSILKNEIEPAIAKNPNYLAQHNMEWNGKSVRQKPGKNNSLGLVKFMFPNSNNIYLHDTPAKSLFNKEDRAFSHGCVRVQKARELAIAITGKDGGWTEKQVDAAMHKSTENSYTLKKKIPVYLTYFTAWADKNGNVVFFDDVYDRDDRLSSMLYM
ncbi:L,D-transpeptidase family protein [Flavobacterium alkalisoli]|uniref:L,D-transpeptidase family protein n=1 Tax=Flavobacterium alkalisoli TaxID=2602769 RepID=UPI003A94F517